MEETTAPVLGINVLDSFAGVARLQRPPHLAPGQREAGGGQKLGLCDGISSPCSQEFFIV